MKIADLKQPYRRMAEYLSEAGNLIEKDGRLKNDFVFCSKMDLFIDKVEAMQNPEITPEIKKHFPPDFDFSGEEVEEVVNTNSFSVDGLCLNQIAVRMFRKNFMDLELWEQGLVNETFEQNVIAKNSIIELPNNLIIQNRIYTQLAKEGKFEQLPDTCEFSEPVELLVWDFVEPVKMNDIDLRLVFGKFRGAFIAQNSHVSNKYDIWQYAKLPTPKIDFSKFKSGDVVEVELSNEEKRIGWFDYADRNQVVIKTLQRKGNQVCNGGSCSGSKMFNLEKIKSITKIK